MHSMNFYNLLLLTHGLSDRIGIALGAILFTTIIGFIVGPIMGNANPPVWALLDKLFGFGRKSYKVNRSPSSLALRGFLFGVLYIGCAAFLASVSYLIAREMRHAALDVILLSFTLTGGAVWLSLSKLHQALKEGSKLERGSYRPIAISTRSNLNTTDDYGITRVGISFMPKSFDKGLVAPLFWYLIAGLPGAYIYAGIACAAWALSKEGYAKRFGEFLIRLESIVGIVPNFLSGFYLMLAAVFTPTARITRVLPMFFKRGGKAHYAEGGLPLVVTAWALDVSLGGPVADLEGSVLKHGWVGPPNATARLDKAHLKRAIYMGIMAYILVFASLMVALLFTKIWASA